LIYQRIFERSADDLYFVGHNSSSPSPGR
jgi:hypothetical protein